jgi:hypothetical protein
MRITLTPSTGVEVVVWREQDMFGASRSDMTHEAQICMGIDLFEVIAELAELDLEDRAHAHEALELAEDAQRRLRLLPDLDLGRSDSSEL